MKRVTAVDFIRDSFANDCCERELRLSISELELLKQMFYNSDIKKMDNNESKDSKQWYRINIGK